MKDEVLALLTVPVGPGAGMETTMGVGPPAGVAVESCIV